MVYVRDKTVWQYKLLTRILSKEEAPSEAEFHGRHDELGSVAVCLTSAFNRMDILFEIRRCEICG